MLGVTRVTAARCDCPIRFVLPISREWQRGKTRSETQFHYVTRAKFERGYLVGRENFR